MERMAGEIALSTHPGATMRKWRETFAVTQAQLAVHLGVRSSVVSDYESGRRPSPGVATVRRVVEGLLELDAKAGGPVAARFAALEGPVAGILDIGEYRRNVPAKELVERIDGRVLVGEGRLERDVQGYTLIDSVRAIASLGAMDYVRLYGASAQRALCFTGVKYGRSPMIAVRVHPMKPAMVVYQRPEDVDKLAHRLAEAEQIPLVVTELEPPELQARLRALA